MKSRSEGPVNGGGTADSDTVGSLPALRTVSKGAVVQMTIVKGDLLLMAGVRMRKDAVATERGHSRQLAAVALSEQLKMTILDAKFPKALVLASLILYVICLANDGYYIEGTNPRAWSAAWALLLLGWLALGTGVLAWLANPVLFLG